MKEKIRNEDVEKSLRKSLKTEGYTMSKPKKHGETGVDILAKKNGEVFHIEVIGYSFSPSKRARDFYEVFFRAISRLNDNAIHLIIALPEQFKRGLSQRIKQHEVGWKRIGNAFPELEIWFVDIKNNTYKKMRWRERLER
ncbi:hypothetical protein KJ636_04960 [Patescibacteria group bacterium]|nr:hypothetical protein [Patescibacteria group bacterium]MBU4480807.1 hypothetical protein [Patescibacteria group bacterium]